MIGNKNAKKITKFSKNLQQNDSETNDPNQNHKKRKHSLKGSMDRVLFAAGLEFHKILVPRLPQHTSNVNTECARKSICCQNNCVLFMWTANAALTHLNLIILVLICF